MNLFNGNVKLVSHGQKIEIIIATCRNLIEEKIGHPRFLSFCGIFCQNVILVGHGVFGQIQRVGSFAQRYHVLVFNHKLELDSSLLKN